MSDAENPYRSPAAVVYVEDDCPEPSQAGDDLDRLLRLKSLERDGRHLIGTIVIHLAFGPLALASIWLELRESQAPLFALYRQLSLIVVFCCGASGLAMFLVGMKLALATNARIVGAWALGLLLPASNLLVATVLAHRVLTELADRGVRFGLLACDYSRADVSARSEQGQRR